MLSFGKRDGKKFARTSIEEVNLFNLVKYASGTLFSKEFVVKEYVGGNTQVPIELWAEDGVKFEVKGNSIAFHYSSVDFVLKDTILKLRMKVYPKSQSVPELELVVDEDGTVEITADEKNRNFEPAVLYSWIEKVFKLPVNSKLKTSFMVRAGMLSFDETNIYRYIAFRTVFGWVIKILIEKTGEMKVLTFKVGFKRKVQISEKNFKNAGVRKLLFRAVSSKHYEMFKFGLEVIFILALFKVFPPLFFPLVVIFLGWRLVRRSVWKFTAEKVFGFK